MRLTAETTAPALPTAEPPPPGARQAPLFTTSDGRVDWVDVAKGVCILFVVMMHATLGVEDLTGETSWMGTIVAWAQPFRMPDFFFIAGLFLMKTIDAPWRRYLDRKVVHFVYFYLLWMLIQCVIKCAVFAGQPQTILPNLLEALYEPYGTLWFIYILPIFFVVTRLTKTVPIWLMLGLGAALEIAPIATGYLLIDEFASRFVYFYAGYALAPYAFKMADYLTARTLLALAALLLWGVVNTLAVFTPVSLLGETYAVAQLPFLSLFLGGIGALAVVTAAALITNTLIGKVFSYMGARSIVIYLAFFVPMVVVREIGVRLGVDTGTLSLLTTMAATAAPLILYWIIGRVGVGHFLFERPAWARIDGSRRSQRAMVAPAE